MEHAIVSGIAHDTGEAKMTLFGVPDQPGIAADGLPAAGRGGHQRRHDRAERLGEGSHRHLVHAARERPGAGDDDPRRASRRRSRPRASSRSADIAKVSLIGAA